MRLIDADALCKLANKITKSVDANDIMRLPTIDAIPVVHGHWIDTGSGQECSICGEIQYGCDSGRFYCQNCGAKMDENENARIYEEGYADGKRDAVVHGHWEMKWHIYFHQELPVCSCCRKFAVIKSAHCPDCGAKMDESTQSNDSNSVSKRR